MRLLILLFLPWVLHASPTLDAHVHIPLRPRADTELRHDAQTLLRTAQHALLISPTYLIGSPGLLEFADLSARVRGYEQTARLIAQFPGRFLGLCGLNLEWRDLVDSAGQCLALPGMVGLKLRDDSLVKPAHAERLRALLTSDRRVRAVLIHLRGDYPWALGQPSFYDAVKLGKEARAEVAAFVRFAREFPTVQFIAAHSFNAPDLSDELARVRPPNVWIEISTALELESFQPDHTSAPESRAFWRLFAQSWRHFGTEHVLFGSDAFLGDELPTSLLRANPHLSPGEIRDIEDESGQTLWRLLQGSN